MHLPSLTASTATKEIGTQPAGQNSTPCHAPHHTRLWVTPEAEGTPYAALLRDLRCNDLEPRDADADPKVGGPGGRPGKGSFGGSKKSGSSSKGTFTAPHHHNDGASVRNAKFAHAAAAVITAAWLLSKF
jgi:hypothetical protein